MMSRNGIQVKVRMKTAYVLTKLREHLATHADIVREARVGYLERARAALVAKMAEVEKGKIIQLSFNLSPPVDRTTVYLSAISMLTATLDEEVTLDPDEYRRLIENKWEWSDGFFTTNSRYSKIASDAIGAENVGDEAVDSSMF